MTHTARGLSPLSADGAHAVKPGRCEVPTKTEMKHKAQDEILYRLCEMFTVLTEQHAFDAWEEHDVDEFSRILSREQDRVAKLFGYDRFPYD